MVGRMVGKSVSRVGQLAEQDGWQSRTVLQDGWQDGWQDDWQDGWQDGWQISW